jgi:L-methionine (R)-S-oxide reductase
MAETQIDVRGMDKAEAYRALQGQLDAVCAGIDDEIALMVTMACLLHQGFGFLWTGFYRAVDPARLLIGPYQGTLGCLEIAMGRGVCGTAASERRTVIVDDVRTFHGHITCDARSLSEIVVPIFGPTGELIAVLDIDSAEVGTFDEEDRRQLESWVRLFARPV